MQAGFVALGAALEQSRDASELSTMARIETFLDFAQELADLGGSALDDYRDCVAACSRQQAGAEDDSGDVRIAGIARAIAGRIGG